MPDDHKKAGKNSKSKTKDFHGKGTVEGKVPIPPEEEITIQGAREVLEKRQKKNTGKSYDCKVIGTETHLIIKRKSVVGSAPKELSFACTDILRFFIFARDPRLVILVVPEKPEGSRSYLLLKMHDDKQANQVCNVIQEGRKRLNQTSSAAPQPAPAVPRTPSKAENSLVAAAYKETTTNQEMQEKPTAVPEEEEEDGASTTSSEESSDEDIRQTARSTPALFAAPVPSKEDIRPEGEKADVKPSKRAMSNEGLFAASELPRPGSQNAHKEEPAVTPVPVAAVAASAPTPVREDEAAKSPVISPVRVTEQKATAQPLNQSPAARVESPIIPQPKEAYQPLPRTRAESPVPFTQMDDYEQQQQQASLKIITPSSAVESGNKAGGRKKEKRHSVHSPRSLPRQALEQRRRMDPPVTEEMWYNYSGHPKEPYMPQVRNLEELKQQLLRDLYDEDWSVDVKIVETVGDIGSRISEQGSVYMFAAHHLVPEDHGRFDCQSSHGEETSSTSSTSSSSSPAARRHRHGHKANGLANMQYSSSSSSDEEIYGGQKMKLVAHRLVST